MIQMLVDRPAMKTGHDLSSLKRVVYGASSISEAVLDRAMAALPGVEFFQAYGMTELSPVATINPAWYRTAEGHKAGKLRSGGRASLGTEVRIVDELDAPVQLGTVGEVAVRGPNVSRCAPRPHLRDQKIGINCLYRINNQGPQSMSNAKITPNSAAKPKVAKKSLPSAPKSKRTLDTGPKGDPTIEKVVAPAREAVAAKPKQKLVRDSFTIPKSEYAALESLKARATMLTRPAKKGELLRAGIKALHQMKDEAFLAALNDVPSLKTGRPKAPESDTVAPQANK